ncbi:MAG: hypothetical protein KAR40_09245 [Candidatus Sabulitectum sp.]|nr:hypothetical protein [Candidatus Sabulitectum sp.]
MSIKVIFATVAATTILLLCGCGAPASGDFWLIAIGNDSISVDEMVKTWNELDTIQREVFLSEEMPSRNFIEAYMRKKMLLRELDALGYLEAPSLIAFGESWLRIENAILVGRLIMDETIASISPEELEWYRTTAPRHVWFTTEPGSTEEVSYSLIDMRTLPQELCQHFDTLHSGSSVVNISGAVVRLDSIAPFEPAPDVAENADSVDIWRISKQRSTLFMIDITKAVEVSIDSLALKKFALNLFTVEGINREEIVIRSEFRDWTTVELQYEIDFLDTMMPVQPNSFEWLCFLTEGLILHFSLLEYTAEHYPETLDSLLVKREAWLYNLALDRMRKELVSDLIAVTDTDIEEQYALLEKPFMFEERRVLETAILPENRMAEFERFAADDDAAATDMIMQMPPLERLSDNILTPEISRPMRLVEVPAGLGHNVFQLHPSDTIVWYGPYPIDEADGFIFYRLVEIIPAREAEMEEITFDLRSMAQRRLERLAIEKWMLELSEKYGAVVNEEALEHLSADPGDW